MSIHILWPVALGVGSAMILLAAAAAFWLRDAKRQLDDLLDLAKHHPSDDLLDNGEEE